MTHQTPTSPETEACPDPIASERIGRHAAWLAEFGELVMRASRAVAQEIEAAAERPLPPAEQDEPSPALDGLALSLTRLGRALRLTCALETKLDEERQGLARLNQERQVQVQRRKDRDAQDLVDEALDRSETVRRSVEDLIDAGPEREREALYDKADEALMLLDALEPGEILKRPISGWIANTCEVLGLEPDWNLFENEPWALEEAVQRQSGSPFAKRRLRDLDRALDCAHKSGP